MATNEIPNLHEDIIFLEILPRLPVKSLIKFTSVSKSWLSLISSNQFIKTHLRSTSKLHQRIMFKHQSKLEYCVSDLESMFTNEPIFDAVDTKYLFESSTKLVLFMGSCDGLICILVDNRDIILWNPSTTKFKKLPSFATYVRFFNCGLGFDKQTDDYKVVLFCHMSDIVRVYSLRTNEWRSVRLENFDDKSFIGNSFVFVSGKLHWVALSGTGPESEWEIVTFDLATEEYGVLKLPDYFKTIYHLQLCVSEGCLHVLSDNVCDADVWIIGDYELGRLTCTKLATITFKDISSPRLLVYVNRNGEILLQSGNEFVVFNTKDSKFKSLDITLPLPSHYRGVATYVESLVSPFV